MSVSCCRGCTHAARAPISIPPPSGTAPPDVTRPCPHTQPSHILVTFSHGSPMHRRSTPTRACLACVRACLACVRSARRVFNSYWHSDQAVHWHRQLIALELAHCACMCPWSSMLCCRVTSMIISENQEKTNRSVHDQYQAKHSSNPAMPSTVACASHRETRLGSYISPLVAYIYSSVQEIYVFALLE